MCRLTNRVKLAAYMVGLLVLIYIACLVYKHVNDTNIAHASIGEQINTSYSLDLQKIEIEKQKLEVLKDIKDYLQEWEIVEY